MCRHMWDQRYSEPGYAYGSEPNEYLAAQVAQLPKGRALCLAEGQGRNAVFLATQGFDVTAVDQSRVGLESAQAFATERGVRIVTEVADLNDYDLGQDTWSAIISIWAHVPPDVRGRLHSACVRALAPGGVLLLEAYTPAQVGRGTGGPPDPALCMTLEALRDELQGLEFLQAQETERDVAEGRYHQGRSAVVQVLARKPLAT